MNQAKSGKSGGVSVNAALLTSAVAFVNFFWGTIHNNPVQPKWKLAATPEEYKYSSALFYQTGNDEFGFLEHYKG